MNNSSSLEKKDNNKSAASILLPSNIPKPSAKFTFIDKNKTSHVDSPLFHKQIPIPSGADNCLNGLFFIATGTMRSLKRNELKELIEKYGGKLRPSINENTNVFIRGVSEVNPAKYNKAVEKGIQIIDENGLFFIIKQSNVKKDDEQEVKKEETNHVKEEIKKDEKKNEIDLLQILNGKPQENKKQKQKPSEKSKKVKKEEVKQSLKTKEEVKPNKEEAKSIKVEEEEKGNNEEDKTYDLFTEKYRPVNFSEMVGNEKAIQKLRNWISNFDKQEKKAVLISGPPGIGKSTAAMLAAKTYNFNVIEFNASDTRNKTTIEKSVSDAFSNQTLHKYKTFNESTIRSAIIFDEIDGMSSGDKGGVQALAKYIETTKIPIICICNDRQCDKLACLKKLVLDIPFESPTQMEVAQRLLTICKKEGIKLNRSQYISITNKTNGDIRSTINNLQLWVTGIQNASEKDVTKDDPLEAIKYMFKPQSTIDKKIESFFVDYEKMPLLTHEYMYCNGNFNEYADACDAMAYGNEMENVMRETGNWEMLTTFGILSCVYPTTISKSNRKLNIYPHFPEMLLKQSKQTKFSKYLTNVSLRSARNCSVPRGTFRDSFAELLTLKFYTMLSQNQEKELMDLLTELELTHDDVENIREVVDFGINSIPNPTPKSKANLTKLYKQSHSQISKINSSSLVSDKADYYITTSSSQKPRRKKSDI